MGLYQASAIADPDDAARARELLRAGTILPLQHFIEKSQHAHPGKVIDAHLDYEPHHGGYVYEIMILDASGQVWEVEFNAQTGRLVEKELEQD